MRREALQRLVLRPRSRRQAAHTRVGKERVCELLERFGGGASGERRRQTRQRRWRA